MPDSAVVARGRKKAVERGTTGRRRTVKQPLAKTEAQPPRAARASGAVLVNQPVYAETDEVAEFAETLTDNYLQCRELGHQWKPWSAYVRDGVIERTLRCPRCRCERQQVLTMGGAVYSNKYVHPEGYLHKGMGRIVGDGRDVLRLESITRTIKATESKQNKTPSTPSRTRKVA